MQSNNPVFRRSEEFQRSGANAYGNQTYPGNGGGYPGYGQTDPSTWGTGTPGTTTTTDQGRMTIDSVVQKTGITMMFVVAFAAVTWFMTPEVDDSAAAGTLYLLAVSGQRWLGAVTPVGGAAFIAGWLVLAWAVWARP